MALQSLFRLKQQPPATTASLAALRNACEYLDISIVNSFSRLININLTASRRFVSRARSPYAAGCTIRAVYKIKLLILLCQGTPPGPTT